MSHPVNDELLESCYEEAIESFCKSNNLTAPMFSQIEKHAGVQIALERNARKLFEDKCY